MKKLFTLIVIAAITLTAIAQSPQKMNYQCVVRNSSGALVANQAVGMKISILQGSATGTIVFSETYSPNPQTNANGLVTVDIGGGTAMTGTFSGINWASGPFFLKTETDPAGGTSYTITGTSQLLSVPYALYAKTAANGFSGTWADITGKPAFATVATSGSYNDLLNNPSLFSGSYNDLTNKPVLFDGTWTSLIGKPVFFDGTWTSLSGKPAGFADGTDNVDDADNSITNEIQALSLSGSNISLSQGGGSVAIPGDNWGTQIAATDATLAGNGTSATPLKIAQQAATTGQVLKWSGTTWSPGADLSGSSIWSQSGSDIYFNSGNVGIGTSSPATYIHAHGVPVDSRGQLSLSSPAGHGTFISFYEADIFKAFLWFDVIDQDLALQNLTAGDLNLNPFGGNVGIGTKTPGAKLEVAGQIKITGGTPAVGQVLTSDGTGLATWEPPAGNNSHYIGESYGGGIVFYVYDNGQHGLIAPTVDQSTDIRWYGGSYTNTRARADGVGAGLKNTAIIIANQGPVDGSAFAATVCNEYSVTIGGVTYGDWYLPSKFELNLLYLQKSLVGVFIFNRYYWSSTESSSSLAWLQNFSSGSQDNGWKYVTAPVRAVRAF